MTLPPVLYFGNDWFADNRTSSHHVARQLARHTRVLYMEAPGLRSPQATSRDVRRMVTKLARAVGRRHDAAADLAVRTLLQVPLHGSGAARALNVMASTAFTRLALRQEQMAKPIVWCTVPHVVGAASRIDRSLLVYHCIDDYAALPGVDARAVRALDDDLASRADLVIAASEPVFERQRRLNPATILMPHGVDVQHFARAQSPELAVPAELADLPRPVVGFIGLIERWIDLELVQWLAEQMPRVTFVMIGRAAVPQEQLPTAPNVVMLGARPYELLPAYGGQFDAAIIPYRLTDQVVAANPLKLREYLAMGLPVVAVSTPEIDKFAAHVATARTREEFRALLARTLATRPDADAVERRMQVVRATSWEAWMDRTLGCVQPLLAAHVERRVA